MSNKHMHVRVENLDCDNDAGALSRGLQGFRGLFEVKIYPSSAKVSLGYDPSETTPKALEDELKALGFPPVQGMAVPAAPKPWRNPKVLASVTSGVLLLTGWLVGLAGASGLVSTLFYVTATLIGGCFFGREAFEELVFERRVGIELLMTTAAVVAVVMGQAAEGAMLAFLYSISEAAEGYTEAKTRSAIKALMDLTPKKALVRRDGVETEIPVEDLIVGDLFIVKPGQSVPTDGEVVAFESSVNQAPITGESIPVAKKPGDSLFAGSINGEGALEVRATKTFEENTIARIIHMVEEAQERKGKSEQFIERFGARYSPVILLIGVVTAVVPPVFLGAAWATWITRATVFIVAAAPCALVISIPITLVATLGTAARRGVLIKGGVYVEELSKIRTVALDKTGTLTRGEPTVTDVIVVRDDLGGGASPREVVALAAGIETRSEHPLARAILRHAEAEGVSPAKVTNFTALAGAGASARSGETTVYAGNATLFRERLGMATERADNAIRKLQSEGKTVVIVGDEGSVHGVIGIRDDVRPNAKPAIDALHAAGVLRVVMLTGDNVATARAIASELGIEDVHAELKPEDKAVKVRELTQRLGYVLMVGDGVNDAPALAEATVGVAMGAAGTDVALETADVALMADDLEKLAYALRLARRNQSVVRQNLALSALVIGVLAVGALAGAFSLPVAVLGHEISEFVVIGSGLRMLRA